tara:strand:- start:13042 stop:13806 length:765 start_codon:yes stop_codon:yes gene_type:complete
MSHQGVALAIMQKRSVIRGVNLSELVSIRELAKRLGVSDTTVRRAIKKGRIFDSAIVGSKLDLDIASKQFKANCDVAKKRKPKKKKDELEKVSSNENWTIYNTKGKNAEDIKPIIEKKIKKALVSEEEIFGDDFKDFESKVPKKKKGPYIPDKEDPENELTLQRTRKEKAMADMAELKVQEFEGSLVDVEKATLAVFEVMREQRDHWLRFPDRIAANMAAKFGIDKVAYKTELIEEVKKHCKDVGELNFDLTKD